MTNFLVTLFSSFSIYEFIAILFGSFVGMLVGALPGLGATIALIMLLPMTYTMTPLAAILMLISVYQSAEYGGSISAIVLGIPGTPAAMATTIDGHQYGKKYSFKKALSFSLIASSIGGLCGGIFIALFSVPLAKMVLNIADPELFLIAISGLLLSLFVTQSKDIIKSLISVILGLMAGTVGIDLLTGAHRYTFGSPELAEGFSMIAVMVALFAITETIKLIEGLRSEKKAVAKDISTKTKITPKEFKGVLKVISMGSILGSFIGSIPGLGAVTASWFSYSIAKKISSKPDEFGHGSAEGICAPEAANNAAVGGNMIPLLVFGLPGNPTMAVILGAFIIHGIVPGPKFISSGNKLGYGIVFGFLVAVLVMYLAGRILTPLFSKIVLIRNAYLIPLVLILSIIGIYITEYSFFHMWIALLLGIAAYVLERLDFCSRVFIMAYILSPLIETNLRRTLILSGGSLNIFLQRPVSLVILIAWLCLITAVTALKLRRKIIRDKTGGKR